VCHPAAGTRVEGEAFLAGVAEVAVVAMAPAQVVVEGVPVVVDTTNPKSHCPCWMPGMPVAVQIL